MPNWRYRGLVVSGGAVMSGADAAPASPMIFSQPLLTASTLNPHPDAGRQNRIAVGQVRRLQRRGTAGQAMTASIVFFSALGWAGDLGAFFRACSSLAPRS